MMQRVEFLKISEAVAADGIWKRKCGIEEREKNKRGKKYQR